MRYTREEEGCRAWLTYGNLPYEGLRRLWEDHGGSAEAIFDRFTEDPPFIHEYGPQACMDALRTAARPEKMHELMLTMSRHQMRIMSIDDICYPDLLREISDPPVLLYYQGDPDCLTGKCITMVGSRSASPHGLMIAHDVAKELARSGVTIVSGFALGIDTACHEGCLAGGGTTCAVMACGLDIEYPSDSSDLRKQILDSGGVTLSEFPPGSRAIGWHFAIRNRIMSGLSRATMMMECKRKSGSMLTVQHALDQGR
ncbi:MAG: DNA-processing protein DprA, partial [Clostridia bacterium]|nr:DNA-processing protein DprA [Clostridia bacterium]